jgi:hypothetical protein
MRREVSKFLILRGTLTALLAVSVIWSGLVPADRGFRWARGAAKCAGKILLAGTDGVRHLRPKQTSVGSVEQRAKEGAPYDRD